MDEQPRDEMVLPANTNWMPTTNGSIEQRPKEVARARFYYTQDHDADDEWFNRAETEGGGQGQVLLYARSRCRRRMVHIRAETKRWPGPGSTIRKITMQTTNGS